jgi:hypothetical protein
VLEELGLVRSIRACVQGDAAEHVPAGRGPHVVLVEAMQRALEREPQVALTARLAPRLREGALWLPARIAVDAFLGEPGPERDAPRVPLGTVLELRADTAPALWAAREPFEGGEALPPVRLRVPDDTPPRHVLLSTTLDVFGPHRLGEGDSGITLPLPLHALGRVPAGARIELRYLLGERPGFQAVARFRKPPRVPRGLMG